VVLIVTPLLLIPPEKTIFMIKLVNGSPMKRLQHHKRPTLKPSPLLLPTMLQLVPLLLLRSVDRLSNKLTLLPPDLVPLLPALLPKRCAALAV